MVLPGAWQLRVKEIVEVVVVGIVEVGIVVEEGIVVIVAVVTVES